MRGIITLFFFLCGGTLDDQREGNLFKS